MVDLTPKRLQQLAFGSIGSHWAKTGMTEILKFPLQCEAVQELNDQIDCLAVIRCSDVGSGPSMVKRLVEMCCRRP